MSALPKVYVASKTRYAPLWREFREAWVGQATIVSTWIDEAGDGATEDFRDLWKRCIDEAATADVLIAVHELGDVWKGAYIEVGAALASGKFVYLCGRPPGTFHHHPLITLAESPDDALMDYVGRAA